MGKLKTQKDDYTFENFIAIEKNVEAKNIAIDFARNKKDENILVISGKVGIGKTHLALAIKNEIYHLYPEKEIFLIGYEQLIFNIVNNSYGENCEKLNLNTFSNYSLVIIDSFFESNRKDHAKIVFNLLGKLPNKIIITCIDHTFIPLDFYHIEIVDPTTIEKEKIIENQLKNQKCYLATDVIKYIAEQNYICIRELNNFITCLSAFSRLKKLIIDIDNVKMIIKKMNI
jgi:chromosomal replication initiator protein